MSQQHNMLTHKFYLADAEGSAIVCDRCTWRSKPTRLRPKEPGSDQVTDIKAFINWGDALQRRAKKHLEECPHRGQFLDDLIESVTTNQPKLEIVFALRP